MNVYKFVVFAFVLCAVTVAHAVDQNATEMLTFEIILAKLDDLQNSFAELKSAIKQDIRKLSDDVSKLNQRMDEKLIQSKKDRESFEKDREFVTTAGTFSEQNRLIEQILNAQQDHSMAVKKQEESIDQKLNEVANQINHNVSALQRQAKLIEHTTIVQHEQMAKGMQTLTMNLDVALLMISSGLHIQILHQSCKEKPSYPSGRYIIQPTNPVVPFLVYCEQTVFGGGWLVFQYRFDGSVDFFRNWTEYRDGFGNLDGEFWLGLELLHRLTSAQPHELLVELKGFDGTYSYARYDLFEIGGEKEHYLLKEVGNHTGTIADALTYHKGKKFSTLDRDNNGEDSASYYKGAWWYDHYAISNLNGPYSDINDPQSMFWGSRKPKAFSRMLIREK